MSIDFSRVFSETKFGQKGFVKDEVLNYVDELQCKIENLEDEVTKYKNALADNSRHNNNLTENLEDIIDNLNFLLQQKNDEIDSLTKIIKSLETKLKNSDVELFEERQKRERERQQYEESLKETESSTISEDYNLKNEELLKEKDEIIAKQDEQILVMKEKVEQIKQFLIEHQESMKSLNTTIERLTKENNNSIQQIAELQDHIKILESLINQKDVEINKLKSIIDNEISSLKKLVY